MVGEGAFHGFLQLDFSLGDEVGDDLCVVIDLEVPVEVWIILLQGIVAVGAGGDDLLHAISFHHLDVRLGECLIEVFVASPHGRVAAAALLVSQDAEADSRRLENLGERDGDLLAAVVEGAGAAHVEEVFHVGVLGQRLHAQFLGPVRPEVGSHAPGIGVVFHVAVGQLQLGGEVRLHQDLVLPHTDDLGHMLDGSRAVLHAVHAVRAVPQLVEIDGFAHEGPLRRRLVSLSGHLDFPDKGGQIQHSSKLGELAVTGGGVLCRNGGRCLLQPVGLDVLDQLLGRQVLARQVGRAAVLASPAAGARVGVEDLLPGKLLQGAHTKTLCVLEITDGLQLTDRFEGGHEVVGRRRDHVHQPRIGDVGDESEGDEGVDPPGRRMHRLCRSRFNAGKGLGQVPAHERPGLPGSLLPCDMDPEGLDDKSRYDDTEDQKQDDGVIGGGIRIPLVGQAVGPLNVASPQGHENSDEDEEAKEIHDHGEHEVEFAPEESDAERFGDVKLGRVEGGPENKNEEPEEDHAVHDTRVQVLPGLDLQDSVSPEQLEPFVAVVRADFRLAHGGPHLPAPEQADGKDDQCDAGKEKEEQLEMLGVPEYLPAFVADSDWCDSVCHNSSKRYVLA